LDKSLWSVHSKILRIAKQIDDEQRTFNNIEKTITDNIKTEFEKTRSELDQIKVLTEYVDKIQNSTFRFVESSPTERSLEPVLRGLLNRIISGELVITGYFDQYLLKDLNFGSNVSVKYISPELTNSKQDKINLDALNRLRKRGTQVRFHPMLHARMVLSPNEIMVGSADIKSDCLGGRRYDSAIWTNNPVLINSGKIFIDKIWNESKPL